MGIPPSLSVPWNMGVQPLWARLGISRILPKMEFVGRALQADDARVLLPLDRFFLQQRPASPTIAGARASGSSIIDTSPEKTPQMDEKAHRCFICCKCSVCICVVVCVCVCTLVCEACHMPSMEVCCVGDLFPLTVSDQAPLYCSSEQLLLLPLYPFNCLPCQSHLKGIDCFRPPGFGELPEISPDFSLTLTCLDS